MGRASFAEEAAAPDTPSSGYVTMYFLAAGSGVPVTKDDAGSVRTVVLEEVANTFTAAVQTIRTSDATGVGIRLDLDNDSEATNSYASVQLQGDNSTVVAQVIADGLGGLVAGGGCVIRTTTAHPVVFGTNSSDAMAIDTSQQVGIGTLSPGSLLELNLATEDLEIVDAGSAAATEQDWVEVQVGGVTGYIRIFASK